MCWPCKVLKTHLCGFAQFDLQCKSTKLGNLLWLPEYERCYLDADATIGWAVAASQWEQEVVGTHAHRFTLVIWLYTFLLDLAFRDCICRCQGYWGLFGPFGFVEKNIFHLGHTIRRSRKKYSKDSCHGSGMSQVAAPPPMSGYAKPQGSSAGNHGILMIWGKGRTSPWWLMLGTQKWTPNIAVSWKRGTIPSPTWSPQLIAMAKHHPQMGVVYHWVYHIVFEKTNYYCASLQGTQHFESKFVCVHVLTVWIQVGG